MAGRVRFRRSALPVIMNRAEKHRHGVAVLLEAHLKNSLPIQKFSVSVFAGEIRRAGGESSAAADEDYENNRCKQRRTFHEMVVSDANSGGDLKSKIAAYRSGVSGR